MLFAAAPPSVAEERQSADATPPNILPIADYSGDPFERSHLTGAWRGVRNDLAVNGVQFDVQWTQTLQSVVDGGRTTSTRYGGTLDYNLAIDLSQMGVLPGAVVKVRAESRYGDTVNGIAGSLLPVNTDGFVPLTAQIDDDVAIAVTSLNYTQFLSERFALTLGKFDLFSADATEFASGRGVTQFSNMNFLFNATNGFLPYSTLGTGVIVIPVPQLVVSSLVINLEDSSESSGFDDIGDGGAWSTELSSQYRLGDLPGGANLGLIYAFDGDFLRLNDRFAVRPGEGLVAPRDDDSWVVTLTGWQYLYVEEVADSPVDLADGRPDRQGFGIFSRLGFADESTNLAKFSISAGLGGRGILPRRDDDLFGVGYFFTELSSSRLSDFFDVDGDSQGFEAFYDIALMRAASLTLDLQVVDAPIPRTDTAIILGMRLNLKL